MKKFWLVLIALAVWSIPGRAQTGNGAPNGTHFNLNIIGVPKGKTASLTNSDRHTIFVALGSNSSSATSNIYLTQGPFAVCDGNGFAPAVDCSGNSIGGKDGAVFQLPCNSGPTVDVSCTTGAIQDYTVWARALGKPGGNATVTTCAVDSTNTTVCSTEHELLARYKGKQTFANVTSQLTTLAGTTVGIIDLFAPGFTNFFWSYDNNGLKNAQIRFYPNP